MHESVRAAYEKAPLRRNVVLLMAVERERRDGFAETRLQWEGRRCTANILGVCEITPGKIHRGDSPTMLGTAHLQVKQILRTLQGREILPLLVERFTCASSPPAVNKLQVYTRDDVLPREFAQRSGASSPKLHDIAYCDRRGVLNNPDTAILLRSCET